jgi:hypothetical protein
VRSSPAPPRQKFFSRYQIVKDRYPRRVPSRVGRGRVRVFHSPFVIRTSSFPFESPPLLCLMNSHPPVSSPPSLCKNGVRDELRHPEFITRGIRPPPKLCPLCHPPPGAPPSWVSPLSPFGFLTKYQSTTIHKYRNDGWHMQAPRAQIFEDSSAVGPAANTPQSGAPPSPPPAAR